MTADLITRARAGDGDAFRELTEPHLRELQVHCYQMPGSFQDAEDAQAADVGALVALRTGFGGAPEGWTTLRLRAGSSSGRLGVEDLGYRVTSPHPCRDDGEAGHRN